MMKRKKENKKENKKVNGRNRKNKYEIQLTLNKDNPENLKELPSLESESLKTQITNESSIEPKQEIVHEIERIAEKEITKEVKKN